MTDAPAHTARLGVAVGDADDAPAVLREARPATERPRRGGVGDEPVLPPGLAERHRAELQRRHRLLSDAEASRDTRALALAYVAGDVRAFVDDWCWTYDPRLAPLGMSATIPFVLRPRQRAYLDWLEERERSQTDGIVEKSRDEGFSFLTLAFMLHRWLFVPGWAGAVGSRKQDLVDKLGDPKALLPKVRFMLYRLPLWMRPEGFDEKKHDNFLGLINPATGATITGEAGDNMGRGGRAAFYMIDEWAFVEHAEAVEAATSQTARVRIKGSTPAGIGDRFYVDRHSGRYHVFTFDWRANPDKNWSVEADGGAEAARVFPWYEEQRRRLDAVTLAQEVDIDYAAAASGVVIPGAWVRAAVNFPLSAEGERVAGLDVSEDGRDDTVYAPRTGPVVGPLVELDGTPGQKAEQTEALCLRDVVGRLMYDRLGVGSMITATLKHREHELPFAVEGVANSEAPSLRRFEDRPEVVCRDRFADRAAENWWALRLRFLRTYERKEGLRHHPDADCVSIPDDPALIAQLSQPTYHKDSKDRIRVDKYGPARVPGTKVQPATASPNRAEAVLYAFADVRESATILMPGTTAAGRMPSAAPALTPASAPGAPPAPPGAAPPGTYPVGVPPPPR